MSDDNNSYIRKDDARSYVQGLAFHRDAFSMVWPSDASNRDAIEAFNRELCRMSVEAERKAEAERHGHLTRLRVHWWRELEFDQIGSEMHSSVGKLHATLHVPIPVWLGRLIRKLTAKRCDAPQISTDR